VTGHALVLGLGYTGEALARALVADGWRVTATVRAPERARALSASSGVDVRAQLDRDAWAGVTHVLSTVPPVNGEDPMLALHALDLVAAAPRWVGYLSSTSVYGDHAGAWVDEETACAPTSARGRDRLACERAWLALDLPVHVFRLAGIHGPGRSALDAVRRGEARRIVKPGHVVSRCHVDDIVAALRLSMARPCPGRIYDVADGAPCGSDEVTAIACELLGAPAPPATPFEQADLSPFLRELYRDHKRVAARRLRDELGWRPRHTDVRAALIAILAASAPRRAET